MYGDEQAISTLINDGVDMDAVVYEVCIYIAIWIYYGSAGNERQGTREDTIIVLIPAIAIASYIFMCDLDV